MASLETTVLCPQRKKDKQEKQDQAAAFAEIDKFSSKLEEDFAMFAAILPRVRWGDMEL